MLRSRHLNPRLVSISGLFEGQTFPLRGDRFVIGRNADNDLQLSSLEVSRHHCELVRSAEGRFNLRDLDSRHGVFVNGRPVRERRLEHSDLLTVGGNVLLFLLDDTTASRQIEAPEPLLAASTIVRKPSEAFYLDRRRTDEALPATARIARDLQALLAASRALQGSHSSASLARQLLESALEMAPAENAAVFLDEPGSDELVMLARHPDTPGGPPLSIDPSLLDRLRVERSGILAASSGAGSFLCLPLAGRGDELAGLLYAERRTPPAFEERHLDLLGALCALASPALQNAIHLRELEAEKKRLQELQLRHELVGESPPLRRLLELIAKVARADTTVLIRGESGTGKELAAQAIHRSSARCYGPFVAINCATLSETLLESELFGHERGAFTGAIERRVGKLEVARGGTLFLDEVGETKPTLQAKLLRVLQERSFERVGGNKTIAADVRVIAATNRDLEAAIREGTFREDLYYRLKVITLEPPPLRERRGDVALLAQHFLALHGGRMGRRMSLSAAARKSLKAYAWPGNIRELGNVIERAVVLADSDVLQPEDLPDEVAMASQAGTGELQLSLSDHRRRLVLEAWKSSGGDYAAAAVLLGVHVNSFHRMVARLGLKNELGR